MVVIDDEKDPVFPEFHESDYAESDSSDSDVELREDRWRQHIRTTLEAARGVPLEILIRDVYTVHGNVGKARRAVEIAREEIGRRR